MSQKYQPFLQASPFSLEPFTPLNGAFVLIEDEKFLSFCSHDYLRIADHPDAKKGAVKCLLEHGLISSFEAKECYLIGQKNLEEKLSTLLNQESVLFFPSKEDAYRATLSAFAGKETALFIDKACHPYLIEEALKSKAKVYFYSHSDFTLLKQTLLKTSHSQKILVTESILTQTGELSPLPSLIALAEQFEELSPAAAQLLLYCEDSNAFGVRGYKGLGAGAEFNEIDLLSASFNRVCGVQGSYLACKKALRFSLLKQIEPDFSSFLSPTHLGALEAAFDLIPQMEGERKQLQQQWHFLKNTLTTLGFSTLKSYCPIVFLSLPSREELHSLRSYLKSKKILVGSIFTNQKEDLPSSYLSLCVNVCHMPDHFTRLLEAIKMWQP